MTHLSRNLQKTKDSHPIEICQSKVILISFSKGRLKTQITENHDIFFILRTTSTLGIYLFIMDGYSQKTRLKKKMLR